MSVESEHAPLRDLEERELSTFVLHCAEPEAGMIAYEVQRYGKPLSAIGEYEKAIVKFWHPQIELGNLADGETNAA